MIEQTGGISADDETTRLVGWLDSAVVGRITGGFGGSFGEKIIVISETIFGSDRGLRFTVAPAKAGAHNHEYLWCDSWSHSSC